MTLDEIEKLIARHGSVTAEPLRDLIITVVLEAIEIERQRAKEESLRCYVNRLP